MLRIIALLALGTAVYGAALALVQTSARRACGYLFMSQSALVMAGLDCTSVTALAGGLLVWLSAGLAFAGLARCVLVLEARRGRLDLTTYHGGYERMPVLAISFLAMGLACTGFPGTLGFVGQELLVDGAVDMFPVMGFAVVLASALTGLAVLRMYFSLFCGRPEALAHPSLRLGLQPREAWTFVALVTALIGLGIAPRPLVDSRFDASEEILRLRQERISHRLSGGPVLSGEVGDLDATARKADVQHPREHTPAERQWLEETVKRLILRAGERAASSAGVPPLVKMTDLP
jgi:NADH-quinone oxidoreductase subunit M